MFFSKVLRLATTALAVASVAAHLDLSADEMGQYKNRVARGGEALSYCLASPAMKGLQKRMVSERAVELQRIRKARDLQTRAYKENKPAREKWNGISHEKDRPTKDPQELFGFNWDDKPSARPAVCITTPENIYGPFWHEGQLQRQDIRDGQQGIYLRLAMQVIDIATCKPLEDARVDIWQANALGAYSATNTSWLRGWQPSSPWGTVNFDTIFPGNYGGRNVHTHVAVRAPGDKRTVHSGQIFFDEWLHESVSKTYPYIENKNEYTSNIDDHFISYSASDKYDPFVQWSWLGDNYPEDGIVAWITLGVNLQDKTIEQPPNQKRGFRFLDDHLQY